MYSNETLLSTFYSDGGNREAKVFKIDGTLFYRVIATDEKENLLRNEICDNEYFANDFAEDFISGKI